MYIKSVHLQNFRGFDDFGLDFKPNLNLVAGLNGAGKSSLLEGISRGIAAFGLSSNLLGFWEFHPEKDVRKVVSEHEFRRAFTEQFPCSVSIIIGTDTQEATANMVYEGGNHPLHNSAGALVHEWFKADSYPLFLFFRADRHWGDMRNPHEQQAASEKVLRTHAYNLWHSVTTDVMAFSNWFVSKSMERLQLKQSSTPDTTQFDDLSVLKKALSTILPDLSDIYYDFFEKEIIITWDSTGGKTSIKKAFSSLSDGEKEVICLFSEIVRRMCLLNPQYGFEIPEKTSGIVLIDELDLHLHPQWQRQIIRALPTAFPKIQFIATTHSPQIIGEVKADHIALLTNGKAQHPDRSFGLSTNTVLATLMGTSPHARDVEEKLKAISEQIDQNRFTQAKSLLEQLTQEIGHETDDILRLRALVDVLNVN